MTNKTKLSPNSLKVLELLQKSRKPLSAYEIMDTLRSSGLKAPTTVYRALEALLQQGIVHRIESLNAFMACHNEEEDHGTQFAVCRDCGTVVEIHEHSICKAIKEISKKLKFKIEKEMLELLGLCQKCSESSVN